MRDTYEAGSRHELGLFASAIAYSLVISLAPLTLAIGLLGPTVLRGIEVLPGSPLARSTVTAEDVYGALASVAGPAAPVLVVGLILWGASSIFLQVGAAITRIWQQGPQPGGARAFLRSHVVAVALLVAAAAALFASAILGNVLANISGSLGALASRVGLELGWAQAALTSRIGIDFVSSALLLVVAFTVVPRVRPRVRDVAPGALGTAAAYAIGQRVLAYYLSASPRFGALGGYGAVLAFLLWALYTATILLWGAELTHEIAMRRAVARGGVDTAPYEYAERTETHP